MTPLPSYTRPLRRARVSDSTIRAARALMLVALAGTAILILAHAALLTLVALPTLIDPAMVPGCC